MNEVANRVERMEPENLPAAVTPMEMIDRALSRGADPDTLGKLLALQERWEASQGRKAFDAAIAEAKANIKPILKNQTASRGNAGAYAYEDMAQIARHVDPILSEHGLSYRFRTDTVEGKVRVTCVLSHRDGYSEETTLESPPDASGAKSPIQAMGSAITYLQRYSLKAALGLSASKDDDAKAAGEPDASPISADQFRALRKLFEETGRDEAKFCAYYKIDSLEDLPARLFDNARATILTAHMQGQKQEAKPDA